VGWALEAAGAGVALLAMISLMRERKIAPTAEGSMNTGCKTLIKRLTVKRGILLGRDSSDAEQEAEQDRRLNEREHSRE
jgi:hypothetical protein